MRVEKPVDVSVVVMSYNNARYIGETIESVLAQQDVELELIIVDDCSTDGSLDVVRRYQKDPRLSVQVNAENLGQTGNFNKCVVCGTGRYVVVLGSDDILYPGHLAELVKALDANPEAALAYSQCTWIDEAGKVLKYVDHRGHLPQSYSGGRDEVVDLLSFDNYITPSTVMLRRSILDDIRLENGDYAQEGMLAGDWELWVRIARHHPNFAFVRRSSVGYRVHGNQVSQDFYRSERPLWEHLHILELNLLDLATRPRLQAAAERVWQLVEGRMSHFSPEVVAKYRDDITRVRRLLFALPEVDEASSDFLFSVVVTTYNRPAMLLDALRSLSAQTLRDFEVILVNDHGEPVEALLGEFDFPLTYIYKGRNEGLSAARNSALALARGRYVCYLDDDDCYAPSHLQTLLAAFEEHGECVVYTGVEYVAERIEAGERVELSREVQFVHDSYDRERLFIHNYIPVNTWAHPRSMLRDVGQFDTSLTALEDWDLLLRLAARFPLVHVADVTAEVRTREAGSGSDDHMLSRERERFASLYQEIYRRHSDLASDRVRKGRALQLRSLGVTGKVDATPVRTWLASRVMTPVQQRLAKEHIEACRSAGATLTVLVLDMAADAAALARSIRSLTCDVDAGNISLHVLSTGARPDNSMPAWSQCEQQDWVEALNRLLAELTCDWVMLLQAGDELVSSGVQVVSLELLANPDCRAIYADALWHQEGDDLGPLLRPDFNLDYLLSFPRGLIGNWLFRRTELLGLGGFAQDSGEAMELDVVLRLINQQGVSGFGHVSEPLVLNSASLLTDSVQERDAIIRHLRARGYDQAAVVAVRPGQYRVEYGHSEQPLVSIVIIVRDQLAAAQRCVMSVLEHTQYPRYQILLVDNASSDPATLQWLQSVEEMASDQLLVLRSATELSDSDLYNQAALNAEGDYLLLLQAEAAVLEAGWLDALLNHGLRPEVGAVGAKAIDADGKVTSAGLVLGLQGPAGRVFVGESVDAPGYMQRLQVDLNPSALGAGCVLVRKSVYVELGGLDAVEFDGQAALLDLCLRLTANGHLLVWTPAATLLLASTPEALPTEVEDKLYQRWLPRLARDPAYNANFSLVRKGGFKLTDTQISWRPLDIWRPSPVVLAHPADIFGCGHYRVIQPFGALLAAGLVDGALSQGLMHPADLERYNPDVIILQRQIGDERLEAMRRMKAFSPAFKVYELDDYLPNLPMKSVHRAHMPKDIVRSLKRGLALVDRFVVSTEPLAEALSGYHPDIRVVPNRLEPRIWGNLPESLRGQSGKPRVGWAGGSSHTGDLELIMDVVRDLASEVEWVFFGMCPDAIRPYVHEFHPGVRIDEYPRKLASLNLDLALAPVEENLFNECKSNLRLLEYGICAYPVICSDVRCYAGDLPVTRVKNRYRDWMEAIRMHLADAAASASQGKALQQAVRARWMLDEQGLTAWQQGWLP